MSDDELHTSDDDNDDQPRQRHDPNDYHSNQDDDDYHPKIFGENGPAPRGDILRFCDPVAIELEGKYYDVAPLLALLHEDTQEKVLPVVLWNIIANYVRPAATLFRLGAANDYGQYNDQPSCWKQLPTLPANHRLRGIRLDMTWNDQGWGNAKGQVWLKLMRPVAPTTATTPTPAATAAAVTPMASDDDEDDAKVVPLVAVPPVTTCVVECWPFGTAPQKTEDVQRYLISPAAAAMMPTPMATQMETSAPNSPISPPTGVSFTTSGSSSTGVAAIVPVATAAELLLIGIIGTPLIDEARPGDIIEVWRIIGGGGGHELHIKQLDLLLEWTTIH